MVDDKIYWPGTINITTGSWSGMSSTRLKTSDSSALQTASEPADADLPFDETDLAVVGSDQIIEVQLEVRSREFFGNNTDIAIWLEISGSQVGATQIIDPAPTSYVEDVFTDAAWVHDWTVAEIESARVFLECRQGGMAAQVSFNFDRINLIIKMDQNEVITFNKVALPFSAKKFNAFNPATDLPSALQNAGAINHYILNETSGLTAADNISGVDMQYNINANTAGYDAGQTGFGPQGGFKFIDDETTREVVEDLNGNPKDAGNLDGHTAFTLFAIISFPTEDDADLGNSNNFFFKEQLGGTTNSYVFDIFRNKFRLSVDTSSLFGYNQTGLDIVKPDGSGYVDEDEIFMVVVTWEQGPSGNVNFYINTTFVQNFSVSSTGAFVMPSPEPLVLGGRDTGAQTMQGSMGDMAILPGVALDSAEITTLYNWWNFGTAERPFQTVTATLSTSTFTAYNPSVDFEGYIEQRNPLLWYKYNELHGLKLIDYGSRWFDIDYLDLVETDTPDPITMRGLLDNRSGYRKVLGYRAHDVPFASTSVVFDLTTVGSFSIAFMIHHETGASGTRSIFNKSNHITAEVTSTGNVTFRIGNSQYTSANIALTIDTDHLVVLTYNASAFEFDTYLDDTLIEADFGSGVEPDFATNPLGSWQMGEFGGDGYRVDQFVLLPYALDATQVAELDTRRLFDTDAFHTDPRAREQFHTYDVTVIDVAISTSFYNSLEIRLPLYWWKLDETTTTTIAEDFGSELFDLDYAQNADTTNYSVATFRPDSVGQSKVALNGTSNIVSSGDASDALQNWGTYIFSFKSPPAFAATSVFYSDENIRLQWLTSNRLQIESYDNPIITGIVASTAYLLFVLKDGTILLNDVSKHVDVEYDAGPSAPFEILGANDSNDMEFDTVAIFDEQITTPNLSSIYNWWATDTPNPPLFFATREITLVTKTFEAQSSFVSFNSTALTLVTYDFDDLIGQVNLFNTRVLTLATEDFTTNVSSLFNTQTLTLTTKTFSFVGEIFFSTRVINFVNGTFVLPTFLTNTWVEDGVAWKKGMTEMAPWIHTGLDTDPPNPIANMYKQGLYQGINTNPDNRTIVSGLNMQEEDGMLWIAKPDDGTLGARTMVDTIRLPKDSSWAWPFVTGSTGAIKSSQNLIDFHNGFTQNGFRMLVSNSTNRPGFTQVYWNFIKTARFFDCFNYTGDGIAGKTISHSLGVVPGVILIYNMTVGGQAALYHIARGNTKSFPWQSGGAEVTDSTVWDNTSPTTTEFTVGTSTTTNTNNSEYLVYMWAHDPALDGAIQCGSYTGTGIGSNHTSLGWRPQYVLIKRSEEIGNWNCFDTARGLPDLSFAGLDNGYLEVNASGAEITGERIITFNSDGFDIHSLGLIFNSSDDEYVYIAIREPVTGGLLGAAYEPIDDSPTSYYKLNETTGTVAEDLGSDGIDLTYDVDASTSAYSTPSMPHVVGEEVTFDEPQNANPLRVGKNINNLVNRIVSMAPIESAAGRLPADFSIEFQFYKHAGGVSTQDLRHYVSASDSSYATQWAIIIDVDLDEVRLHLRDPTSLTDILLFDIAGAWPDDYHWRWFSLVMDHSGTGKVNLRINNVDVSGAIDVSSLSGDWNQISTEPMSLNIGARKTGASTDLDPIPGGMAETYIYDKVLTSAERDAHYDWFKKELGGGESTGLSAGGWWKYFRKFVHDGTEFKQIYPQKDTE